MEFGLATNAGYAAVSVEPQFMADAAPTVASGEMAALDRIFELLALSRVRMTMVCLDFGDVPSRVARRAAQAAAGTTGFLTTLSPQRFLIVDVGPRGASPRDDQAIAERVRALAMAVLSERSDMRRLRLKSAELHFWSDQAGAAALRLSEIERLLAGDERPAMRDQRRRPRLERAARVA